MVIGKQRESVKSLVNKSMLPMHHWLCDFQKRDEEGGLISQGRSEVEKATTGKTEEKKGRNILVLSLFCLGYFPRVS